MCHKEQKMGTMVERIQPVSPANFLYNTFKIFMNTGNALTPSRLRTPFGARPVWFLRVGILDWKGASSYPQPERCQSISPTRKGPCKKRRLGLHIKSAPKDARRADAPP